MENLAILRTLSRLDVMSLAAFVAKWKRAIHEDLLAGRPPREGAYDDALLAEGRTKGPPQIGAARFEPRAVILEFIFPEPNAATTVFTVRLPAPERIVYLPLPEWVVETIWQGSIEGSYQFESDALRMLREFEAELEPSSNEKWFGRLPPKRRE